MSAHYGLPLQIHLSETVEEVATVEKKTGLRPARYLDRLGLLGRRLVAAHAIHVDVSEIALLAERGAAVIHVPESNMKLAEGVAPTPCMHARGIIVGLGTDGCASNNNLDLFREMDTAAKLSKVAEEDPSVLSAGSVLRMATVEGARALGLLDRIGTLEIGKQADMVIVSTRAPHMCPLYNAASALVYAADGSDVRDVVVNGRFLLKNRQPTTLDVDEILGQVRRISKRIAGG
jgi:5-methylthioadenosine/S-adenosylhomocysteine deaminase